MCVLWYCVKMSEAKIVEAKAQKNLQDFDPEKKKPKRNKYAFACAILSF